MYPYLGVFMKVLFILALALVQLGLSAQASTMDGYTLPLISNDPNVNFVLNTIQTRTEYRSETVAKTCYRREFDGYRNVCQYYPEMVCYEDRMSRRICETQHVYRCHSEPQYRSVPYTCYETISVPYEVFSHNVKANINVKKPVNFPSTENCELQFTLAGQSLRANATCASLIVMAKRLANEKREGSTLIQDHALDLTFLSATDISAPIQGGIADLRLEGQKLVFRTGDLSRNPNFHLKLFVERKKFLKDDEVLINRTLAPSEYSFEKTTEQFGIVKIDLAKLIGGVNHKKKHVFKVNLDVNLDRSSVLNTHLPNLSADASLTVNE